MVHQHQNLLSGTEVLESQLRDTFAEYLNAEIVLRNVVDLQGAIRWLKSTFLYVRVKTCTREIHSVVMRVRLLLAGCFSAKMHIGCAGKEKPQCIQTAKELPFTRSL